LAGLRTQTDLALRQNSSEEIRDTLQRLNTATTRTTHLINQLLLLARAEPEGQRIGQMQKINIAYLVREVTAEWVPQALAHNIDLGFDDRTTLAEIDGDALLIGEMLRNLLDNAIRYTPSGGRVTVRVTVDDNIIVLDVEDNGPGIPEPERERVFERFYRILGSGVEGCGLGLAIVREIAQRHQAQSRLLSGTDGVGTIVRVEFPKARS
jgi:two-component system sensor histidine kinase TctE